MKELIVIIGTVLLGIGIFNMMVVSGPGGGPSLLEASDSAFTSAVTQFE